VQSRLVSWLASRGYSIRSVADTAAREAGKDIVAASPDGEELWVSVKGYPQALQSTTSAPTQARHWFASAVFDLVLYASERDDVRVVLGLPDGFQTYRALAARIQRLRDKMGFQIAWVSEAGGVRVE
jgi:hypothetical protein